MPRIVDADQRRTELAEAVWRVIRREGIEHASVRQVAREAGLSMGSLRHYFASQAELLAFALRLVVERIEARMAALDRTGSPRQVAERALAELLPLDAERRAEAEVWLAFASRTLVDPTLHQLNGESHRALRGACRLLLMNLGLPAGRDLGREAARLHALLDGLVVHAVLQPADTTPATMRSVIAGHLDELMAARRG